MTAFEQHVTADGGFAYGVINADLHVHANGEPLYLLTNWQPEPEPGVEWLRQVPSRLLNARHAVVPFTGRVDELTTLRDWRDGGPRLRARWLHGPGGQGKTRLATQFAAESREAGWRVVAAFHGPDADRPPGGSQDLTLDGTAGLLLLVDYADRWLLNNLTWLFNNLLHLVGVPTRVLLIGRSLDAWPAIRALLDSHRADTSPLRLADLPPDGARARMFAAARERFAAVYGYPEPAAVTAPVELADPDFGLTLAVHMAALVAVDAAAHGGQPPTGMDGLTSYLLNREQLHWARLHHDGITGTGSDYRTPGPVMNRAVFIAALTGTMDRSAGSSLCERLDLGPDPGQVLTDHAVCYPPADPAQGTVLEPMYPDRLAEDFLALTLPGHAVDYPAQAWATGIATALLVGDDEHRLSRGVTFLAAATERWPHVGTTYLYPLLYRRPDLAVRAGGSALNTVAAGRNVPIGLLEALEPLMPADWHMDLDVAAATITTTLTPYRLERTTDPEQRAWLHGHHSVRPGRAGRYQEALDHTEQAMDLFRQLAAADPGTFTTELATALNNRGIFLSDLGRREEAADPTAEATNLYLRLADADPGHLPDLALSLNNLSSRLAELGDLAQALAPAEQSVTIRRRLAAADPDTYRASLANSLNTLGHRLSDLGRREQALAAVKEAADLFEELAARNPQAYLPDLAMSTTNLSTYLADLGRHPEALAPALVSTDLHRQLAKTNPEVYLPRFALSLNNLGNRLYELGRHDEALGPAAEAVALRRRLAAANPEAHLPDLAMSLSNLSNRLVRLGISDQALTLAEEALTIRRRLAAAYPALYRADLATSLNNLSNRLSDLGRAVDAVAASAESVDLHRELATANPEAYLPDLAKSLNNLGIHRSRAGRQAEAMAAAEEAAGLYRELAAGDPDAYRPMLATSVHNLAVHLGELGHPDRALMLAAEAVELRRRLVAVNPDAYRADLASSLNNLGGRLSAVGRPEEEAAALYRRLAAPD